ncbi:hydroxyacid oxidase 1-like [Tropilaelaps mercedesae]|uniref:(S)-2-hydroxy-acid oxidase n=1 Tax=Tropilaelaps mercedesae TaxID=418985 RepID=A0A1V9X9I5_9ACAR|nr:hydroxyacid oxidase 1-like [Tropilaelaps mercedesae]
MVPSTTLACVKDFENTASQKICSKAWDYYRSGADTEYTLCANETAFLRYRFRPRVLRDVSHVDLSTTVLGTKVTLPIFLAPSAMQKMASERGELDTARAASKKGTIMVLSTLSTTSIEDVAHEFRNWTTARGALWFQLYIYKDREITQRLVRRAERAGFKALCLTVDAPYLGNRRADARNRFEMPSGLTLANFDDLNEPEMAAGQAKQDSWLLEYTQSLFDASISWKDIAWLRSITSLKIVLKGIVTAEDAELAVHHGVDGILVSNHGGRQLDGAPATVDALPEVVAAVRSVAGSNCEVYLDGGIRTGADVAKAIALGARAVFIGRPVLWGLAHNGSSGVEEVLSILGKELRSTMGLLGATNVNELTLNMVAPVLQFKL